MDQDKIVHVGGKGLPLWQRLLARRVIVPFIIIVVIILGSSTAYYLYRRSQSSKVVVSSAIKTADASIVAGNYEQSYSALKEASTVAESKADKIRVYNSLSLAAAITGRYQEAIDYMNEKHKVDPSSTKVDAAMVGDFYEKLGRIDKAIEQYKIAVEYATTTKTDSQFDPLPTYEAKLKILEAKQQ